VTPRTIGLFGASFDPPHVSHVLAVAWALSAGGLDEVRVVPVWRHAFGKALAPYEDRLELCRRAFALFAERTPVSTVERDIAPAHGPSRTIETLRHLVATEPDHRFVLLLGSDAWAERHLWTSFDEIERLAPPLVLGRQGVPDPAEVVVSPQLPGVSSTEIRARLRRGEDVFGLVPREVLAYVRARGLYGCGAAGAGDGG
jgi:nicotinate-nucleotide adenylyltransferase